MTRYWLAAATAFSMMTGVAQAQVAPPASAPTVTTSPLPPLSGNSPGSAAPSAPAAVPSVPANPAVTNYGAGGTQPAPGSPPAIGTPIR